MSYQILKIDPYLAPFEKDIRLRMDSYQKKRSELLNSYNSLSDFANGHLYFGFHKVNGGWYYREWAPAAEKIFLVGDFNHWDESASPLRPIGNGIFEIFIEGETTLYDGCHVKIKVYHNGASLERIPAYIHRVVQDDSTNLWCGVIEDTQPYLWKHTDFKPQKPLFIYECHIGMAQEKEGIGTYREFCDNILPYISELGYNTIQIMAIMEHPYYGSFGYQVSSFFAASSRFGSSNDLKYLIDTAHGMGITVLLDVVHSHAVKNTVEGLEEFDGTSYQYFHEGPRGNHPAWGTKLFNYNKNEVLHFLLSNLKYWLCEYHFDGFRFDGVTSMIYHDHGLGSAFTDYGKYFSLNTDTEAITYLQLANELIKEVNPHAVTIAEDMSAMPGMCLPIEFGGIGFDYRLAMGLPDLWISLIQNEPDENWNVWHIWHELTSRRPRENYIGYAESHDQALVGDKTLLFRLCDSQMYTDMNKSSQNLVIDRGIALHKIIRFLSLSLGGEGYLNFMGNEFGHPEWIDFPREGNGWSYFYCRRQWHLAKDSSLRYESLLTFDRALIKTAKESDFYATEPKSIFLDEEKQILVYERNGYLFIANLNPTQYFSDYNISLPKSANYQVILSSDDSNFGGWDRISKKIIYRAKRRKQDPLPHFSISLPPRTCICLKKK